MKSVITAGLVIVFGAMFVTAAPAADANGQAPSTTHSTVKDKAIAAKDTIKEKAESLKEKISAKLHPNKVETSATDIRTAQRELASEGYNPGPADGRIGPKTESAIASFQRAHGLKATGRLDMRTASLLQKGRTGTVSASPRTEK